VCQRRHHRGDAAALEQVEVAGDRRRRGATGAGVGETCDCVQHHELGLVLVEQLVEHGEVFLEAECGGAYGAHLQQARVDPPLQVEADREHVAHELLG
jgi:hypothetical protein